MNHLLEVDNLHVQFDTPQGLASAVDGASFHISHGETLGLVGESGCGKTVTSLSILGLIPSPPGYVSADKILFKERNLLNLSREDIRQIRGQEIAMIFQEPMTSLNPVLPIGRQVAEPLIVHKGVSKAEAFKEAVTWLEHVRIPEARKRLNDYPYQLSGGMRQRIMIAMAMVCRPELLIADEPTTALDVTIQAQILSLVAGLKEELNMSVLLITHDLGVVAQMADRVLVMYAGEIVEEADVMSLYGRPLHPYTEALLRSMPALDKKVGDKARRLAEIPGIAPCTTVLTKGCKFADRCPYAKQLCNERHPELLEVEARHRVRCWLRD